MMDTLIIGFSYKARSGKDTAINAILKKYSSEYSIEKHSFADGLKREVCGQEKEMCERFKIVYDNNPPMDDPLCNSIHGKQRALLQWYGTEYRRAQDKNYWINKLTEHIKNLTSKPNIILIGDARYRNECDWIKSNFGICINVTRPGFISNLTEEEQKHVSENDLNDYDKFDYTLINDSTPEEYEEKSLELFESILKKYNLQHEDHH